MNPAGKGYGGRQKLPDNLKQLFRPVVMSTPDSQVIAEVYLFAEGFKEAEDIAGKLVGLFKVSKQLLSNQQHYDWGLRSIIPVLKSCGSMLRKMKSNKDFVSDNPDLFQLVDVNIPCQREIPMIYVFILIIGNSHPLKF